MFKLDVHTHTVASGHAYSTLLENIQYGKKNGMEIIGMSDHAPTLPGSAYIYFFQNLKHIPKEVEGVRVLKGVEANIIDLSGRIDMTADNLKSLDYCIASIHPPCMASGSRLDNTKALQKVMANPLVNIIGHPDDGRFPLDYTELVKAAQATGTLLEINNGSLNPNGFRLNVADNVKKLLEACEKEQLMVILGSDAHFASQVGDFSYCQQILQETGFPESLVINHHPKKFLEYLNV